MQQIHPLEFLVGLLISYFLSINRIYSIVFLNRRQQMATLKKLKNLFPVNLKVLRMLMEYLLVIQPYKLPLKMAILRFVLYFISDCQIMQKCTFWVLFRLKNKTWLFRLYAYCFVDVRSWKLKIKTEIELCIMQPSVMNHRLWNY